MVPRRLAQPSTENAQFAMPESEGLHASSEAVAREPPSQRESRGRDQVQAVGASSRPSGQHLRPRATVDEFGGHLGDILVPRVNRGIDGRGRYQPQRIVPVEAGSSHQHRRQRSLEWNGASLEEVFPRRTASGRTFAQAHTQPESRESRSGSTPVAHSNGDGTEWLRSENDTFHAREEVDVSARRATDNATVRNANRRSEVIARRATFTTEDWGGSLGEILVPQARNTNSFPQQETPVPRIPSASSRSPPLEETFSMVGPQPANMSFVAPPAPLLGPQPAPRTRSLSSTSLLLEDFFPPVTPRNTVPPPTFLLPPPAAQRTTSVDHFAQRQALEDFFPPRRASMRFARRALTPPHQRVRTHHRTEHFAPRHPTSPVAYPAHAEMHNFLPSPVARITMDMVNPALDNCMVMFETFDHKKLRVARVAAKKGPSEESCSICLVGFGVAREKLSMVVTCQHKYHQSCINDYAKFAYTNHGPLHVKCPLCRTPFYGT